MSEGGRSQLAPGRGGQGGPLRPVPPSEALGAGGVGRDDHVDTTETGKLQNQVGFFPLRSFPLGKQLPVYHWKGNFRWRAFDTIIKHLELQSLFKTST